MDIVVHCVIVPLWLILFFCHEDSKALSTTMLNIALCQLHQ